MGPVRIRHSSHDFGWQSSHSVDLAGWQAKMASIEIWIPWRNAHKPHWNPSKIMMSLVNTGGFNKASMTVTAFFDQWVSDTTCDSAIKPCCCSVESQYGLTDLFFLFSELVWQDKRRDASPRQRHWSWIRLLAEQSTVYWQVWFFLWGL